MLIGLCYKVFIEVGGLVSNRYPGIEGVFWI